MCLPRFAAPRRLALLAAGAAMFAWVLPGVAGAQTGDPAGSGGLGVAPAFLNVDEALRGSSYSDSILLLNGLPGDREFTFVPTGDVAEWITFVDPDGAAIEGITLPQEGSATVQVNIAVPAGAANGSYTGRVEIKGRPLGQSDAATAAELTIGAVVEVAVQVGGEMRRAGRLADVRVEPAEVGQPLRIVTGFVNGGNVGFDPVVKATLTRAGQPVDVVTSPGDETIDPGRSEDIALVWDTTDTLPGEYRVDVVATAEGLQFEPAGATFRIEPAGSVERSGSLESFEVVSVPQLGGTARLRAGFRNDSAVPVKAVLVAEVSRDGQLVGEVRSLEMLAPPGNVTPIDVVVEDLAEGSHVVVGKVNYEGRETATMEATFDVLGVQSASAGGGRTTMMAAGAGIAGLAIAIPLIVFRRRRHNGEEDEDF